MVAAQTHIAQVSRRIADGKNMGPDVIERAQAELGESTPPQSATEFSAAIIPAYDHVPAAPHAHAGRG